MLSLGDTGDLGDLGDSGTDGFRRIVWRIGDLGTTSSSKEKSSHSSSDGDVGKSSRGMLGRLLDENGSTSDDEAVDKCRCNVVVVDTLASFGLDDGEELAEVDEEMF